MKNPQVDGQKIYQEYLEGGHPNPSSLEDLRYFCIAFTLIGKSWKTHPDRITEKLTHDLDEFSRNQSFSGY